MAKDLPDDMFIENVDVPGIISDTVRKSDLPQSGFVQPGLMEGGHVRDREVPPPPVAISAANTHQSDVPPPPVPAKYGPGSGGGGNTQVTLLFTAVGTALALGGAAFAFWLLGNSSDPGPQTLEDRQAAVEAYPTPEPAASGDAQATVVDGPSPEVLYDSYLAMANDGSIYEIIPRTDEGWDYYRAFMYKVLDYKIAEQIGGVDLAARAEMYEIERRFLNLEDLGYSVDIKSGENHFVHDGKPPA